jgi:hypothetical protein
MRSILKSLLKSWRHPRNIHRSGNFAATEVWFCRSKWLLQRHPRGTKLPNVGVFSEVRSDLASNIAAFYLVLVCRDTTILTYPL